MTNKNRRPEGRRLDAFNLAGERGKPTQIASNPQALALMGGGIFDAETIAAAAAWARRLEADAAFFLQRRQRHG